MATTAFLQKAYLAYFGRPVDFTGTTAFANSTELQVQNAFSASAESQALYGSTFGAAQINAIYLVLFGRAAEPAGLAYWSNQVQLGLLTPAGAAVGILNGALNADAIAVTNKLDASAKFTIGLDTTAKILGYSGNVAAASARDFLATVTATPVTPAQVDSGVSVAVVAGTANTNAGTTFTLTSGVDNLIGTGSNDTFVADNTGSNKQLSIADSITGGAGNDTLKIFLAAADTATSQPTLTSIENVYINGGIVTAYTAAAGTTQLQIDAPVVGTAATYTLGTGTSISLANHTVATSITTTIAAGATNNDTTLGLSLNNQSRTSTNVNTLDLSGTKVTAANLATTGAASTITLTNTGAALVTLNISGDKNLSLTESVVSLKTINASTATGNVSVNQSGLATDNQLTFTGGTGADTLTFKAAFLTAGAAGDILDGGAGIDTLVINDTAPVYAAINAAKNFEVLALGSTGATVDTAQITSLTAYSVKNAGTTIFANSANATTYAIDNSAGVAAVTVANTVGQGTANVTVANAATTAGAQTLTTLTLTGASTINLVSANDGQVANTNVITNLVNGDNSAITITGAAGLTVALSTGTAVGSSVDGSAATGKLLVTGSNFGDLIKGGAGADTLTGGAGADTLTGGAGNDIFVFATRATTQLNFNAADTTTSNIDKITDFAGNGALAGDSIQLGVAANAFGAGIQFTTGSTATVTAVTVATAASFTALAAAVQVASAGVASTNAVAQVYDVTVTAGSLAGRYVIVNDDILGVAATDTFISITGAAALNAQDFTFA